MAELVDAPDSKSGSFGSVGSIPISSTMKTYIVTKEIFFVVKEKLDGLVFWREEDNQIHIRKAAPQKGLTQFLESISIKSFKHEQLGM